MPDVPDPGESRRLGDPTSNDETVHLSGAGSGDPAWRLFLDQLRSRGSNWTRYVSRGEIARGGMGAIERVFDLDLRRFLARKVILDERMTDDPDRALGRFLEEAQVTGQLDHPGIAPVHELGVDDRGNVYFTMKLVKGEDLRSIFDRVTDPSDADWTEARALSVLLRVCEAMQYAHSKGVVHRDLKPGNVMVGRFGEVFVMDWGLARVLPHDLVAEDTPEEPRSVSIVRSTRREVAAGTPASSLVTHDDDVVGSPSFMSPEQAKGDLAAIGPPSDVYAVGAMLYRLLSGRCPYAAPGFPLSPAQIHSRVLEGPPTPVRELRSDVPEELLAICGKSMARSPADRYASMELLAHDLRAYLEDRVVRAHRTGAWAEFRKWVTRNRPTAAALAALLLVLVGGGLFVATVERRRAETVERNLEEREAMELAASMDELFPLHPSMAPTLRDWLERARTLTSRLDRRRGELVEFRDSHRDADRSTSDDPRDAVARFHLHSIRARLDAFTELAEQTTSPPERAVLEREATILREHVALLDEEWQRRRSWRYSDRSLEGRHRRLADEVEHLERLASRSIRVVEERLALVEDLRERTVERNHERWERARSSIRNRAECPLYEGLDLSPQVGLVPLRRNAAGLWEFWHVLSGEEPHPDDHAGWRVRPETGLVLILVPGGRRTIGAQTERPDRPNYCNSTWIDGLMTSEQPEHPVDLDPYFLSRYELTQGQWRRLTGDSPSERSAGDSFKGQPRISRTHPVENVSWSDSAVSLERWNLTLPTEVQWEHAARAGHETPYWTGQEFEGLEERVNFCDMRLISTGYQYFDPRVAELKIDDGYAVHAPVDALAPNPWGFHAIVGNVWEWCLDWHSESYADEHVESIRAGTGEHVPRHSTQKSFRGGSFRINPSDLRFSRRFRRNPDQKDADLGVRAARSIVWNP